MLQALAILAGQCPDGRHLKPSASLVLLDGAWALLTVTQKPSISFKQNRGWWLSRGNQEGQHPTPLPAQTGKA